MGINRWYEEILCSQYKSDVLKFKICVSFSFHYSMYFCRRSVVRSTVDDRTTTKTSPDWRPIVGRWWVDDRHMLRVTVDSMMHFWDLFMYCTYVLFVLAFPQRFHPMQTVYFAETSCLPVLVPDLSIVIRLNTIDHFWVDSQWHLQDQKTTTSCGMTSKMIRPGPRSIGRIDPVDPADPRNGTRRSGGSDRIVRHVPKRRSKSIQYGGRLSNVLMTCSYMNYGRCINLCCQNDAICCESDVILQKSTSLLRLPSLFSKYR